MVSSMQIISMGRHQRLSWEQYIFIHISNISVIFHLNQLLAGISINQLTLMMSLIWTEEIYFTRFENANKKYVAFIRVM